MKPIHKVCKKDDLGPAMQYFQVKDGFCWATNAHMIIKLPVAEVFGQVMGEDLIKQDEELYFLGKAWEGGKFHTSNTITRDGLNFTTNKGLTIIAKTLSEFTQSVGRFPDIPVVIHDQDKPLTSVDRIGFNPVLMLDLMTAFGMDMKKTDSEFCVYFYGEHKGMIVTHPDSKGFGLIMPCMLKNVPLHPFLPDPEVN